MSIGRIYGMYKTVLQTHTYKVQAVQTGFLLGMGDLISQCLIEQREAPIDYRRTLRFVAIGTAMGPTLHKWYSILDQIVGKKSDYKTLIKKTSLDQLVMAPMMLGVFLTTITILEGGNFENVQDRIKRDYVDILKNNYKVWPAVQLVTFSLPASYRVLFVQFVAVGWNTYLAWRVNYHDKINNDHNK